MNTFALIKLWNCVARVAFVHMRTPLELWALMKCSHLSLWWVVLAPAVHLVHLYRKLVQKCVARRWKCEPFSGVTQSKFIVRLPYYAFLYNFCLPVMLTQGRPCVSTYWKVSELGHAVVDFIVSIKCESNQTVSLLSDSSISIPGCTSDINRPFMTFPLNSNQQRHQLVS